MDVARTLSKRVAAMRAQHGLTFEALAEKAGMSKSYVWEIEAGRGRKPTIETVFRLSTVLGVSPYWLIGHDDDDYERGYRAGYERARSDMIHATKSCAN